MILGEKMDHEQAQVLPSLAAGADDPVTTITE